MEKVITMFKISPQAVWSPNPTPTADKSHSGYPVTLEEVCSTFTMKVYRRARKLTEAYNIST